MLVQVDWIAKDPRLAVATDRKEVFQSCFFFRSRLPVSNLQMLWC